MTQFAYHFVLDDDLKVGDVLDGRDVDDVLICPTDPRRLDLLDMLEVHGLQDPEDLVRRRKPFRLAQTVATGDVTFCDEHQFSCPDGWKITGFEPIDLVFGPQSFYVVKFLNRVEQTLRGSAGDAYVAAVEALYADPDGARAYRAAYEALDAIRADADFWDRGFGPDMLALVARDLIGTTADWTWEAYGLLTEPWRRVVGDMVHPGDGLKFV